MAKKGFTFIEVILTLSILAGGILGLLALYQQNIARANEMEKTAVATYLAQSRLEQIIQDKKYRQYSFITTNNYAAFEDLSLQGFLGFTRTTAIQEVNATDLTTSQNATGYKKITVSVPVAGGDTVTLETLVTQWGG